ncbi:ABC transporter ATP-binding protein [Rhizobium halophytocola]|uniref:Spermidine/putrescine transport system ATP-binding protein n=1 Tax=Rhizobium halophytocola TaxID=735519 RepID=A0ABS4DTV5_9HYPH|nr:ABC transporter ATP-binding protein [Rhizobium halophytocola]MBP1849132.1 putative spermidine/putrescine transport system ATP-binding protein [Rhizobium halophytocola]
MSDQTYLTLDKLTLAYGRTPAVKDLDLAIRKGELLALLGPSGCGKTTTMRAIAGLMSVGGGRITLDGRDITKLAANKREIGLVFQSYALFPHLTVFDNVAFGLKLQGMRGDELRRTVEGGLKTVGLLEFAGRKTPDLSGGQQQRVALARSLVMQPKVLMLDEPLSNLDARLRLEMRTELQRVQKESGVTMIFVTHDQIEALALADRIVVMRGGAIEQIGTPEEIYNHPVSSFVADFVGFENIFPLKDGRLVAGNTAIDVSGTVPDAGGLAWRPRAVPLGSGPLTGLVRGVSFAGNSREYVIEAPFGMVKAEVDAAAPVHSIGSEVRFDLPVAGAAVLHRFG